MKVHVVLGVAQDVLAVLEDGPDIQERLGRFKESAVKVLELDRTATVLHHAVAHRFTSPDRHQKLLAGMLAIGTDGLGEVLAALLVTLPHNLLSVIDSHMTRLRGQ